MPIAPETRFAHYEVIALLGAGGMGEVYRARDLRLGREVAIKVIKAGQPKDAVARFGVEARAAGGLNHQGIVAVFDIGELDGQPYVVTELLEGETLRQKLAFGPMGARKAAIIGAQVARALAAAHARGVIHRDIKPENLFVSQDGNVKILDFGLAKLRGADKSPQTETLSLTGPGVMLGTVPYMPPEHARGAEVDERGDIFSFGVTLYEMVAGRRPFTGGSMADVLTSILREEPPPLPTNVPIALQALIRRCLEKDRDDRFGSARDLGFALEAAVLDGASTSGSTAAGKVEGASGFFDATQTPKPEAGARSGATPKTNTKSRRAGWGWAVLTLVLMGLTMLATRKFSARGEPVFSRVSYGHEVVTRSRFGLEEGTVLFSSRVDGRLPRLFIRRRGLDYPTPLEFEDADLLSVSSKGELALLMSPRIKSPFLATGRLARAPISGGAPRDVMDGVALAEWSPDGESFAVVTDDGGIARIEFPRGTVLFETGGIIQALRFSPRGERIAFLHQPVRGQGTMELMVMPLKGAPQAVGPRVSFGGIASMAWQPDGEGILIGGEDVQLISLSGARTTVMNLPGSVTVHDIDHHGRWLLDTHEERADVVASVKGSPPRLLAHQSFSLATALSPKGDLLAFSESGPGRLRACLRRLSDNSIVELGPGLPTAFSADARYVLTLAAGSGSVTLLPTGVGDPKTLPGIRSEIVDFGAFSPDGRAVAFIETQKEGRVRVFVQNIDGEPSQTTLFSGKAPWSGVIFNGDSKGVITAISNDGLSVLPLDGGKAKPIPGTLALDLPIRVGDRKTLYLQRLEDLPGRMYAVNMATGQRTVAFETAAADPAGVIGYGPGAVTSDGRTWAMTVHRHLSRLMIAQR
jgi:hypothetical protein